MLAAFDTPAETFRADLLPEYKANRPAAPDSLRSQLASIREACAAFGVPHVAEAGLEADDLIATAAVLACERAAANVVIVSTDKDFLQLVSDDGAEGAAAEAAESGGGGGCGAGTRVHVYDHKKKLAPRRRLRARQVRRAAAAVCRLPGAHRRQLGQRARRADRWAPCSNSRPRAGAARHSQLARWQPVAPAGCSPRSSGPTEPWGLALHY